MSKNQQDFFCQQLIDSLHETQWHFTALLTVCIDAVKNLPDNVDDLINDVLHCFPQKPSYDALSDYINQCSIIFNWFAGTASKPSIQAFNLSVSKPVSSIDPRLPQLEVLADLAGWLGIPRTQLEWLSDYKRVDQKQPVKFRHYYYQLVKKRRGGMRLLESPKTLLKDVQRIIHTELLVNIEVHQSAHGFRKNHSCLSHAENHTNQKFLFMFDLANYFHSIGWYQIYRVFRGLGYNNEISKYLSCLCSSRFNGPQELLSQLDAEQCQLIKKRHLAQGAPTSPILSNLVMRQLDRRLHGLARSLQLQYSRYADDIAFSGSKGRDWSFLEALVGAICLEEGFALNYRKTREVKAHQRQKITGVIVNQGVNIDRRYFDQLKAILTNCIRHGVQNQNIEQHNDFQAYLFGRIMFVKSLNANKGLKLLTLYKQISFE